MFFRKEYRQADRKDVNGGFSIIGSARGPCYLEKYRGTLEPHKPESDPDGGPESEPEFYKPEFKPDLGTKIKTNNNT